MGSPFVTPFAGELYDRRPAMTIADLILRGGQIQAQGHQASGDIWGNVAAGLGQIGAQAYQEMTDQKQRAAADAEWTHFVENWNGDPREALNQSVRILGPDEGMRRADGLMRFGMLGNGNKEENREDLGAALKTADELPEPVRARLYPLMRQQAAPVLQELGIPPEQIPPTYSPETWQFARQIGMELRGENQREEGGYVSEGRPQDPREEVYVRPGEQEPPSQPPMVRPGFGGGGYVSEGRPGDPQEERYVSPDEYDIGARPGAGWTRERLMELERRGAPPPQELIDQLDEAALSQYTDPAAAALARGDIAGYERALSQPRQVRIGEMSAGQEDQVADIDQAVFILGNIEKGLDDGWLGPIAGRWTSFKVAAPLFDVDEKLARFWADRAFMENATIQAISGAAVSGEEAERLKGQIPQLTDKPAVFRAKIQSTIDNLKVLKRRLFELNPDQPGGEDAVDPVQQILDALRG